MQKTLRASLHLARNFEVMTSQDMLRNMLRFPGTIEQCGDRKCLHKLRRHLRIRRLLLARLSLRRGRTKIRFYWVSWRKNRRFTTWYLQRHDEPFSFFAMRVAGRLLSRKWMWAGRRRRTKPFRTLSYKLRMLRNQTLKRHPKDKRRAYLARTLMSFMSTLIGKNLEKKRFPATLFFARLSRALFPNAKEHPKILEQIVHFAAEEKWGRDVRRCKRAYIALFGPGSSWQKTHANSTYAKTILQTTRRWTFALASHHHSRCLRFRKWAGRAKKYKLRKLWRKKSKRACLAARPWTQKLLDWEPSLKERSQWTMMLAQSEAYSGDVEKAMVTYRQVRNMPHAMQACQASDERLALLKRAHRKESRKKRKDTPADDVEQRRFSETQKQIVAEHLFALRQCPMKKEARRVRQYTLVRMYREVEQHQKMRWFGFSLLKLRATGRWARLTMKWMKESLQQAGESERVALMQKMFAVELAAKKKRKRSKFEALVHRMELLEEAGLVEAAVQQYLKAYKHFSTHKRAPMFLWKAALLRRKQKRFKAVERLLLRITKEHSDWNKTDRVLYALAEEAQRQQRWKEAIDRLSLLVNKKQYARSDRRQDALYMLSGLWAKTGQFEDAITTSLQFVKEAEHDPRRANALYTAARLAHQHDKKPQRAIGLYESFIKSYKTERDELRRVLLAHGWLVDAHEARTRSWYARRAQYRRIVRYYVQRRHLLDMSKEPVLQRHISKATYGRMEIRFRKKLKELKIESRSLKKQRRELSMMIQMFESIEKMLKVVRGFAPNKWTLRAAYELARHEEWISAQIAKIPPPRIWRARWTKASRRAYQEGLARVFLRPLRHRTIQRYRRLIDVAKKADIRDTCVRASAKALQRLEPTFSADEALRYVAKRTAPPVSKSKKPLSRVPTHKALTLDERQCVRGDAKKCAVLGHDARRAGKGARAQKYFRIACILEDGKSCRVLGELLEKSKREQDIIQSRLSYQKGCHQGDTRSCVRMATLHAPNADDDGVFHYVYLRRACEKDAKSCLALSTMLAKGQWGYPNKPAASSFRKRACRLGLRAACQSK
tara:strand:+ start:3316 stop:6498 length:3183 start_codon:yes stop_codon:yes gene_type:complete